jgi:hypothetical protein
MYRQILPLFALCFVASGCALSGHHCTDGGGCGHVAHLPNRLACGGNGCGEVYWDEWLSDPPACEDPCDDCGNYVGPRSKLRAPFAWCNLWGVRNNPCGCDSCDSGTSCEASAPSCGSCGGCDDCTSAPQGYDIPREIHIHDAAPLKAPEPPPEGDVRNLHRHRRRGVSLVELTSAKLSGRKSHSHDSAKLSAARRE